MILTSYDSVVNIHNKSGTIIHTSRNLRGFLDHARRSAPSMARVFRGMWSAVLLVKFDNGDYGSSEFADIDVCINWVQSRRSWGLTRVDDNQVPDSEIARFIT